MKRRYCFLAFSDPTAGKEAEYNRWYDETHLTDVLAIPGMISARRYKIANEGHAQDYPTRYLAFYEVETDDPDGILAEMQRRAGTSAMPISDAIDVANSRQFLFAELGDRVIGSSDGSNKG